MARIKGKAKKEVGFDGIPAGTASMILGRFRSLQRSRKLLASAKAKRPDIDVSPIEVHVRCALEDIGELVASSIESRDAQTFRDIAGRIQTLRAELPIDDLDEAIRRAWGIKRMEAMSPCDPLGDSARVSARELAAMVRRMLPGRAFERFSTGEKFVRTRAKKLGVRFLAAGRPRKSP